MRTKPLCVGQNGVGGAGGKADESIDNIVHLCRFRDDLKSWLTEHQWPPMQKINNYNNSLLYFQKL